MTAPSVSANAVLVADQISVGYSRRKPTSRAVLTDVNVSLRAGELACLIGSNGAGKSTLLRSLARFQPLLRGDVRIDDASIGPMPARELARKLAVVLTDRVSAGQLLAYEVVALGRHPFTDWSGRLQSDDRAAIERALSATGADRFAYRPIAELSDGEQQRVMLARALAQEPRVLLLDEPTAFLDVRGRLELITLLLALAHEHGLAVLMSTHDIEHMLRHADTVWLIDHNQHLTTGAPEDLALDGSIQRTLAGAGILDPHTGTIHTRPDRHGTARVLGAGPAQMWTGRALQRIGFRIDGSATTAPERPTPDATSVTVDIEVSCHGHDRDRSWTLHQDGKKDHVASLAELVALIRARRPIDGQGQPAPSIAVPTTTT